MNPNKLTVNAGMHLLQAFVSVSGIKRTTREISDERIGPAQEGREIVNQSDTVISNLEKFVEAKTLENRVRGLVKKYTTDSIGFHFTDLPRLGKFRAEMADLQLEINAHNSLHPEHRLTVHITAIEIAAGITPELSQRIFGEIEAKLITIETALRTGDLKLAGECLIESKNLSALTPTIVATLIEDALLEAREGLKSVKGDLRDEERRAVKAGRAYNADPAALGRALNLSKLEAAIGWVTMNTPEADPTATQPTANA